MYGYNHFGDKPPMSLPVEQVAHFLSSLKNRSDFPKDGAPCDLISYIISKMEEDKELREKVKTPTKKPKKKSVSPLIASEEMRKSKVVIAIKTNIAVFLSSPVRTTVILISFISNNNLLTVIHLQIGIDISTLNDVNKDQISCLVTPEEFTSMWKKISMIK